MNTLFIPNNKSSAEENFYALAKAIKEIYCINLDTLYYEVDIFCKTLLQWNAIHSLSKVKNKEEIYNYLLDSCLPLTFISPLRQTDTLLDIGSGSGFPAIGLFLMTKCHCILTEPNIKKASFLQNLKIALKATQLEIYPTHTQKLQASNYQISLITSRATMSLANLLQVSQNFRNNSTQLLFYKGSKLQEEIAQITPPLTNYQIFNSQRRNYFLLKN